MDVFHQQVYFALYDTANYSDDKINLIFIDI